MGGAERNGRGQAKLEIKKREKESEAHTKQINTGNKPKKQN